MNSVGDRDGIMNNVLNKIAPPTYGDAKSKGDKSGGQKKAKTQQKEVCCDNCLDFGDGDIMLSCTDCNASFHPVCDDPPLDETQAKPANWRCRKCRNQQALKANSAPTPIMESASTEDNERSANILGISDTESEAEIIGEDKDVTDEGPAQSAAVSTKKSKGVIKPTITKQKRKSALHIKQILKRWVADAKDKNPTLFDLPPNMPYPDYSFPGTSRSHAMKGVAGAKMKPVIVDLENFCIPRPLAICFKCGRSCQKSPLLKCDYCPNFYHFDCLTPPLTTPPVGLWICPLHPEPFLENRLLKTTRLSERVALWDMTHKRVNPNAVVLRFLTNCSRPNPPFARKIPWPQIQPFTINPGEGNVPRSNAKPVEVIPFMDMECLKRNSDTERKEKLYKCYNDSFKEFSELDLSGTSLEPKNSSIFSNFSPKFQEKLQFENIEGSCSSKPNPSPHKYVSKSGSYASNPDLTKKEADTDIWEGLNILLKACEHVEKRDRKDVLYQRPPSPKNTARANNELKNLQNSTPKTAMYRAPLAVRKPLMELLLIDQQQLLQVFEPQVFIGSAFWGKKYTAQLDPTKFSNCSRFSDYNAFVYFDYKHKQWEILNYSRFGLSVDCIRYTFKPAEVKEAHICEIERMKNEILSKRKILLLRQYLDHFNKTNNLNDFEPCECYAQEMSRCSTVCTNEGSAFIHVGSEIQIGCLKMVVKTLSGMAHTHYLEHRIAENKISMESSDDCEVIEV